MSSNFSTSIAPVLPHSDGAASIRSKRFALFSYLALLLWFFLEYILPQEDTIDDLLIFFRSTQARRATITDLQLKSVNQQLRYQKSRSFPALAQKRATHYKRLFQQIYYPQK